MKIAIPVDVKSMETGVSLSFGRSPYFLMYDSETKESTYLYNSAAANEGGAGIKAAQIIVDSNVNILITPRCGKNTADVFKASDIEMYNVINDSIENNINAFTEVVLKK